MNRIAKAHLFWLFTFSGWCGADEEVMLDCVVEPSMLVELASEVRGVIERIYVERGDFVRKGQLIADLMSGVEDASVRLAMKRAQMEVDIKSRLAEQEFRRNNFEQVEQLHAKKLVSHHDFEDAKTASKVADFELQKAYELKKLAALELQRTQEILNQRSIVSTVDGVTVEIMKSPGEFVEEQPVVKIAQIDPLYVEMIVPESFYGRFKTGDQMPVNIKYPDIRSHLARVSVVDSVIDASSGTFGVRLTLPNPGHKIPAGQSCNVTLEGASIRLSE